MQNLLDATQSIVAAAVVAVTATLLQTAGNVKARAQR
jgi:hypothetical protein